MSAADRDSDMVEVKRDRKSKQKEVRLGTGEGKKRMEFVALWGEEKTQIQTRLVAFRSYHEMALNTY